MREREDLFFTGGAGGMCVDEKHRRRGVAVRLYKEHWFESREVPRFTIVVGKSLETNGFILCRGARMRQVSVHLDAISNVFVKI